MICPRCDRKLIQNSASGQTHRWDCSGCGGCAIDCSLAKAELPPKIFRWLWELAEDADPSFESRCPKCRRFAHPVSLYLAKELVIDTCKSCLMLWFEPGELTEIEIQFDSGIKSNSSNSADLTIAFFDALGWLR